MEKGTCLRILIFVQTVVFFWIRFYRDGWNHEDDIFVNVLWPIYYMFTLAAKGRWEIIIRNCAEIWLTSFVLIVVIPFFCILCFFSYRAYRASKGYF